MNNSLDKLISNDELLTYTCLILAILNILLMSTIINDIGHHFSFYIFLLFEAFFLIFIIYFLLKKKDVYNKDDEIKYDWYFYLRVSIIVLVFVNFALYIYNKTKDPIINPKKFVGGEGVFSKLKTRVKNFFSKKPESSENAYSTGIKYYEDLKKRLNDIPFNINNNVFEKNNKIKAELKDHNNNNNLLIFKETLTFINEYGALWDKQIDNTIERIKQKQAEAQAQAQAQASKRTFLSRFVSRNKVVPVPETRITTEAINKNRREFDELTRQSNFVINTLNTKTTNALIGSKNNNSIIIE